MLPYLILYVIFSLVDTEIDGSSCIVCSCVDRQTEAGKDLENVDIRYIVNPSTIRSQRQRKGYHGDCVFTSASLQIWHREPVSMVTVLIHLLPNQSANSSQCVCACVRLYVSDSLRWFLIPLPESVIASALASQHKPVILILTASIGNYKNTHAPADVTWSFHIGLWQPASNTCR